jgi:DNA-binding MarR family transcriptional regulator
LVPLDLHDAVPISGGDDCRVATISTPEPSDDGVLEALLAASRVMVGLAARSIARLDAELTLPQYRMLVVLAGRGPQRTSDLAAELGVTPSTVTRTCDRLVRRGLAQRRQRSDDRRVAWVALTEAGKSLIGDVMRRRRAEVHAIAIRAGLAESGTVAAALEAFVAAAGELPERDWWQSWEICDRADGHVRL